jgi:beta-glucanase (GH16 family)
MMNILYQRMLCIYLLAINVSVLKSYQIDPETLDLTTTRRRDGAVLDLVMSDEFSLEDRSFAKGDDDVFEAQERPDDVNMGIEFYKSSKEYVTTKNGNLVINTEAVKTSYISWDSTNLKPEKLTKNYTSGMVQTWNKFCFTGGVLELSIKLPGHADSGGIYARM